MRDDRSASADPRLTITPALLRNRGMNIDAPSFKQAMRECAGAVALVTVGTAPWQRTALAVTSACALSDKPPALSACVNRNASDEARIVEVRAVAINFLPEDH